jgi:ppGpp synthetase/RelA/SpoT-type nucleotidyltranferase
MQDCPWPLGRLKKLGDCIRDGVPIPDDVPEYKHVMLWYNDLAADSMQKIAAIDWTPLLGDRVPEITSRPKTIDTLRQKLIRERRMNLPSMQDIAGVRFDAEMTLSEQDGVASAIAGIFAHDSGTCIKDIRANPHSGYRGVHLHLRLQGRVEVQIRTHLQSEWANMYEAAGDVFGRGIRYKEPADDPELQTIVDGLQNLSTKDISQLELAADRIQKLELTVHEIASSQVQFSDTARNAESERSFQESKRQLGVLQKRYKTSEDRFITRLANLRYAFENARREGA